MKSSLIGVWVGSLDAIPLGNKVNETAFLTIPIF